MLDGSSKSEYAGYAGKEKECNDEYNFMLDEVEQFEFYENKGLPEKGENVYLDNILYDGRLIIFSEKENLKMGAVPIIYHSLKNCLDKGHIYKGIVAHSSEKPIVGISIILYRE